MPGPDIAGNQTIGQSRFLGSEELQGFGYFERGDETDDGSEYAYVVAGIFESTRALIFDEARQTGGNSGTDHHGDAVASDGGGINPGARSADSKIVDEQARFKI